MVVQCTYYKKSANKYIYNIYNMVDCCKQTVKHKSCTRNSDKKTFKLPRKYSRKKCKKGVKGFTMRSSCAPFKDCLKGGTKLPHKKNINNKKLEICSKEPLTGYYRDGYCMSGEHDLGTHTVCAIMDDEFLKYTKSKGNNLYSTIFFYGVLIVAVNTICHENI